MKNYEILMHDCKKLPSFAPVQCTSTVINKILTVFILSFIPLLFQHSISLVFTGASSP